MAFDHTVIEDYFGTSYDTATSPTAAQVDAVCLKAVKIVAAHTRATVVTTHDNEAYLCALVVLNQIEVGRWLNRGTAQSVTNLAEARTYANRPRIWTPEVEKLALDIYSTFKANRKPGIYIEEV
jgi:hypothetical protein